MDGRKDDHFDDYDDDDAEDVDDQGCFG